MQEVYKDSTVGKEKDFSVEEMLKSLEKENVDHVKVWKLSKKEIQEHHKMIRKEHNRKARLKL